MSDRKPVRQGIGSKARFEVFKRDKFICTYCGSRPPQAILHIDHIVAVAAGGSSDIDNLTTACSICNGGKGARDLKVLPMSLAEKAEMIVEREAQLQGYAQILEEKRQRLEADVWEVVRAFDDKAENCRRDWFQSIKRFVELIGFHETLEAMEIARAWGNIPNPRTFRYFCGVCWRKENDINHDPEQVRSP